LAMWLLNVPRSRVITCPTIHLLSSWIGPRCPHQLMNYRNQLSDVMSMSKFRSSKCQLAIETCSVFSLVDTTSKAISRFVPDTESTAEPEDCPNKLS
jgi:hypothetical protein